MRSVSGTTPADAAITMIGVRVGSEGGCVCDGEAGAVIGDMHYQEKGNRQAGDFVLVKLPVAAAAA
jgi:hypothetical protein